MNKKLIILSLSIFVSLTSWAWNDPNKSIVLGSKPTNNFILKSAGCSPATGKKILEFNNVAALIETGGSMWQDRSKSDASYEVPKGSGEKVIYAGALWMGGMDVNNQLKIAALRFRQGNDFWTGPLSTIPGTGNINIGTLDYGDANITSEDCIKYDEFYITTRAEVEMFNSWYECSQDPDCDPNIDFPNYDIPASILTWPAHGDLGKFHDFNLAPFYDRPGGSTPGVYSPADGDYPWYDINNEIDCRTNRKVTLYGDYNMWWVFNDKGNIHTETGGDPIGMEVRAQAFAFATNDEINSMTFYNYEMINRSTQTLTNTFFGVYLDCDIGCSFDDYVGCDVQRGLGYCYNGNAIDAIGCGSWTTPIGANPPALGVDFFEGPYQDNDGIDNPLTTDISLAKAQLGIPYKGLGIGYGDGVVDNERFGMKRFVYFDRILNSSIFGDPSTGVEYYNYMRGYWRDNTRFVYGATGNSSSTGATTVPTDYCFPGDSDPYNWGTLGVDPGFDWSEIDPGNGLPSNVIGDRRFVQSAGPFTLAPGALNNITFGVVYGRTNDGDPFSSVEIVRRADDKAQALFDNCFRILNGPDSPELVIQELDKELIIMLSKTQEVEAYEEVDPIIMSYGYSEDSAKYLFQGYQLYQVINESVDPSQLTDPDYSRLIAQCDIIDGVSQLVNYEFDDNLLAAVPTEMVNGSNEGISHSFQVFNDAFAQGDVRLINHKKYYFMVLAYGFNQYKPYDPSTPNGLDGQQVPYKAGRKSVTGGSIVPFVGIPHITTPEQGGTLQLVEYGSGPKITRIEGKGTGRNIVNLTVESEDDIIENISPQRVTYENGSGPVAVKVVDPLNVKGGNYRLHVLDDNGDLGIGSWYLARAATGTSTYTDTINSDQTIDVGNEQLIPEWGISVNVQQYVPEIMSANVYRPELLEATIEFADSSKRWLTGLQDGEGTASDNWIRSGTAEEDCDAAAFPLGTADECDDPCKYNDIIGIDDTEVYEGVLEGTFAPYRLVAAGDCHHEPVSGELQSTRAMSDLKYLIPVDIVITSDKSKWTRCPVLETQDNPALSYDGQATKQDVKMLPSIDKQGKSSGDAGYKASEGDLTSATGMGWFPGYAIDLSSGERLNIAYGEDSWLGNNGGKDMMFNPSGQRGGAFTGGSIFGGKHYVYVFRNADCSPGSWDQGKMPAYDEGEYFMDNWDHPGNRLKVWRSCSWVGIPMLDPDFASSSTLVSSADPSSFIETDVRIRIRVATEYREYGCYTPSTSSQAPSANEDYVPLYEFDMNDIATVLQDTSTLSTACEIINVVPNPYYAYSNYEFNKLSNVVKIVNLPDVCNVKIYSVNGTLVRTYIKDSPVTSIDWDLKNHAGIPIASGVYLIHIEVPGVCERVLKWFGVIRPPDLDSF